MNSVIKTVGSVAVKHAPTIMTIAGVAGVVGGSVLACKATLKAEDIIIETRIDVENVKNKLPDNNKALTRAYVNGGKRLLKVYGPSILIGTASLGAILYGHKVMCGRNLALAGAYKALTIDADKYRKRVISRLGEENERSIRYDMQTMECEDPKGNKQIVEVIPEDYIMGANDRSVFFDEQSIYWNENPEDNKTFLIDLQERMQKKFDEDGYLLLSTIYDELDVPVTYASKVCGWLKGFGDDYVDFGIFNVYSAASRRFVNGLEPIVLLNFNDDGYIEDKI